MKRTAPLILFLALVSVLGGAAGLKHWAGLSQGTQAYYVIFTVLGLALLLCGAWILFARGRSRRAALASVAIALMLGVNQGVGLWLGTILCYTPG